MEASGRKSSEFVELRKNYQQEVEKLISEIYQAENWELKSPAFTTGLFFIL
jgi:hypothetical protein